MRDKHSKGRGNMPSGEDHWGCKLSKSDIVEIKTMKERGVPMTKIAKHFSVHYNTIRYIFTGRRKSHFTP
jgi:hypothetical protein